MKYGRVANTSNNSESQVSGDAAENYDQIASVTMLGAYLGARRPK